MSKYCFTTVLHFYNDAYYGELRNLVDAKKLEADTAEKIRGIDR